MEKVRVISIKQVQRSEGAVSRGVDRVRASWLGWWGHMERDRTKVGELLGKAGPVLVTGLCLQGGRGPQSTTTPHGVGWKGSLSLRKER